MKIVKPLDRVRKVILLTLFILTFATIQVYSQETEIDYNSYYRFPLSVGIEYQGLSPFADYGSSYNIYEISAYLRWPIPRIPVLQPTLHIGMINFDNQDTINPKEWDHRHYYLAAGILYSNRFSKSFEIGAEGSAGYCL